MRELPASFHALAKYKQFVVWQAIPSKKNKGKTEKITINPMDLRKHDAHDPAIWLDFQTAILYAQSFGDSFGVGFTLTETDPFWFLDIDGCREGDQWSEQALKFCEYFDGAAIEVSQSGNGLHIIGSKNFNLGPHRKKPANKEHGALEFYTEKRFIALTGRNVMGDAGWFAPPELLMQFKDYYFPPKEYEDSAQWTTEPIKESSPIKTDAALIKKMLESNHSVVKSIISTGASIRDLWERNIDKLSMAYPPINDTDPYDMSSAEQALCNHLAFWTGKDCERMERLFAKSALVRDKWTKRKDYRRGTILNACAGCQTCYGADKAAQKAAEREWNPEARIDHTVSVKVKHGAEIVPYEMREKFFDGHYFLTRWSKVFCPDGVVRGQTEYNSMYGNREFASPFNQAPVKEPWKAYVTCPDLQRAEVYDTAYRPEYEFGITFNNYDNRVYVNDYRNQDGVRTEGDATPFVNHVKNLLPNGDDAVILLSWLAALVQYPGKKFFWSPFLQGTEGNGKSLITKVLVYCMGADHVEDVDPEDFCNSGGKFNSYIKNHRLAVLEEIKIGSRNQAEGALKRFIGSERIQLQKKGIDQITIYTCINWMINSNYKDAIHITDNSRRFAILFCAQQEVEDLEKLGMQRGGTYFSELFDWFDNHDGYAITANFLDKFEIPEQYNPATLADKAPMTTTFLEAVQESKSNPHQALIEMLSSGKPGTIGSWVSIQAVRKLYQSDYGMKPPSGKMLAKYLHDEGYIKHPTLENQGRATRVIQQEGDRSVIYVKKNSPHLEIKNPSAVTKAYCKAQGYDGLPAPQNKGAQPNEKN